MESFYRTDAIVNGAFVEVDGYRIPYREAEDFLFDLVAERELPIDILTLNDVSLAMNDEILEYIREH